MLHRRATFSQPSDEGNMDGAVISYLCISLHPWPVSQATNSLLPSLQMQPRSEVSLLIRRGMKCQVAMRTLWLSMGCESGQSKSQDICCDSHKIRAPLVT